MLFSLAGVKISSFIFLSHFLYTRVNFSFTVLNLEKRVLSCPLCLLHSSPTVSLCPVLLADLNIYEQVWICEKLWLSADGRKFQWNDSDSVQTTQQFEQSPWTRYSRASSSLRTLLGLLILPASWNRSSFTRRLFKLFADGLWSLVWWVLTDSNVSFQTNFGWYLVWET